jgi:hypothetical protein
MGRRVQPMGAIRRGGGPFHFESVARNRVSIQISFDRKSNDALAATLPDLAQSPEGLSGGSAEFFLEFAPCHFHRILAWLDFTFRNRPSARVLVAPERPAGMHEQDLDSFPRPSVHEDARARRWHRR